VPTKEIAFFNLFKYYFNGEKYDTILMNYFLISPCKKIIFNIIKQILPLSHLNIDHVRTSCCRFDPRHPK